ncbi:CHAT domain-containing tetratricopeptide repeat protein [Spirulina sp. 06S082]|uniref:CHAT domain-containing tetratricopeptide repeat protein n=1 Tax=Spirulina sp. 06S082 TaxID=3110248 RepID=UPI002B21C317|nr:CHAT domain-containing tetratricopeptide repeat protein [Spirulina sp. 06S082]MEA5472356.1 CHAT domain-containing tetratricopeptide repeat protein [Spirulina sp. 06S082]
MINQKFPEDLRMGWNWISRRAIAIAIGLNFLNCGSIIPVYAAEDSLVSPNISPSVLFEQGMELYRQETESSWREAIRKWEEALQIWQDSGDRENITLALNWLGLTYKNLGELDRALELYKQALPLFQELEDRHSQASTLMAIGQIYSTLGEYQIALDRYKKSLPLWQEVNYRTGEAANLNSIGLIYDQLGESEQALEYYQQVLAIAREVGNKKGEAAALNNLGLAYNNLGKEPESLQQYAKALQIWEVLQDDRAKAGTLNNIGFISAQNGENDKAIAQYEEVLSIWQTVGDRSGLASTLNNLGVVYSNKGELDRALTYYEKALSLRIAIGDRAKEALSRYRIALAQREKGNADIALEEIKIAVEIVESLRRNVDSQDLRTSFFASKQDYYELYIDLLMQLHQERPREGYDGRALEISERSRSRSLLDILAEGNANISSGGDPELLQRERQLQRQLDILEQRRIRIASGEYPLNRKIDINREVEILLKEYQSVQDLIRRTSPRYAALTQPQTLTLEEIQAQIRDRNTLLLEYFIGEKQSYLWAVTPDSIQSYTLPGRSEIKNAAFNFRQDLLRSNRPSGFAQTQRTAIALSNLILVPVAEELKNKHLLIVSDDILHFIPFAAIAEPNLEQKNPLLNIPEEKATISQYQPLLEKHEIVNLPSVSTLAALRRQVRDRPTPAKTLIAIADPIFGNNDTRIANSSRSSLELPPDVAQFAREAELLFNRLPFTREEAEQILSLLPAEESDKAFGFQATRDFATSSQLQNYKIVHFATHGLFNSKNPHLSGLVFSLVDDRDRLLNGFLRLPEIFNLQFSADLVVLSACQTGLGDNIRGEGVIGLTRGFMYAGAARVAVSLWSVDDRGTAELMVRFYRGILEEKLEPAAALRSAQLQLWQSEQWRSPFFWAAFTLQGESGTHR